MKKKNTGHGPIAILNLKETNLLARASEILSRARKIESEDGNLHPRNYPELAAAEGALLNYLKYADGLSVL